MNILREALVEHQAKFYGRCLAIFLWVVGLTFIASISWQIAIGLLVMMWGDMIAVKLADDIK